MYRDNQEGMTLVEILAAITILGILFVGFMAVFPQMTNFNERTEEKLETMNLARVELNLLKQENRQFLLCRYKERESFFDDSGPNRTVLSRNEDQSEEQNEQKYNYEVTHYQESSSNLIVEGQGERENNNENYSNLYLVHIKILNEDRLVSETFGYVPYGLVATDYVNVNLGCGND